MMSQEDIDYLDSNMFFQEETYKQGESDTNTQEFKDWFEDSKVVDEQGNPLVVYHGTNAEFDTFDKKRKGKSNDESSLGFWLSDKKTKIFGSKIIYIETFANRNTKTATGKIIYKFADLFIVQWKEMLELYPKAKLGGSIY